MIIKAEHFCLIIIIFLLDVPCIFSTWPTSSETSPIQLLGLFQDAENATSITELSVHSAAMFRTAIILAQQYNIAIDGEVISWRQAQTGGQVIEALNQACQALSTSNILGIVGPGLSREAHLIASFAEKIGIPVISYAATDPSLSDRKVYPAFHRTVPSDTTAALAIVRLFLRFNWTSCILIHQNDALGTGGAEAIHQAFLNQELIVTQSVLFDLSTQKIRGDLKSILMSSPTRLVVVWAESMSTSSILHEALTFDLMGPHFTWLLSSSVSLNEFNGTFYQKLIGTLIIEPVVGSVVDVPINTSLLHDAFNVWEQYEPDTFPGMDQVNPYALFAFDATWALIVSLQQLCSSINDSSVSCHSIIGSTVCFDRRFLYSKALENILDSIDFLGVSGPIRFNPNMTDRANGSFYYARNIQNSVDGLHFVSVLSYSYPNDWQILRERNTIVWPGNTLTPPNGRAIMQGVSIRIGVIESPPFLVTKRAVDGSTENVVEFSGYVRDLIDKLQERMKFTPIIMLASSNQTYAGLIAAVANGQFDIVIGDVTVTAARRELVSFSNAIFDNSLRILMRKTTDNSVDLLSFLKPFSRNLWWLTLGLCVFAGVLFCFIERQNNEALQNRPLISQLAMSIWFSFGNMVGYGVDFDVTTAPGRLLTMGLYIISLILVASYTANLTSDLTLSKSKSIISGMDDLKNGKIAANRIGIRVGTAGEDYYLREISGGNRNFYVLRSRKEMYDSLLAGTIDVSFIDTGVGEYMTNNVYCNLSLVGEQYDKGVFGIVTPKEWLYAQELDINILSLRESGVLEDLRQKWFQVKNCPDISETSTAINIETLGGLFLTFAIISAVSILIFFWMKRQLIKKFLLSFFNRNQSEREQRFVIKTSLQNQQSSTTNFTQL